MKHKARLAVNGEPNPQTAPPPAGAGADFYNASHYADPTAWLALERVTRQEKAACCAGKRGKATPWHMQNAQPNAAQGTAPDPARAALFLQQKDTKREEDEE